MINKKFARHSADSNFWREEPDLLSVEMDGGAGARIITNTPEPVTLMAFVRCSLEIVGQFAGVLFRFYKYAQQDLARYQILVADLANELGVNFYLLPFQHQVFRYHFCQSSALLGRDADVSRF